MTDKEKMVMDKILEKGSNFNFNKLDLTKTWEQNAEHLEGGEFYAFPDVRDYGCRYGEAGCPWGVRCFEQEGHDRGLERGRH